MECDDTLPLGGHYVSFFTPTEEQLFLRYKTTDQMIKFRRVVCKTFPWRKFVNWINYIFNLNSFAAPQLNWYFKFRVCSLQRVFLTFNWNFTRTPCSPELYFQFLTDFPQKISLLTPFINVAKTLYQLKHWLKGQTSADPSASTSAFIFIHLEAERKIAIF